MLETSIQVEKSSESSEHIGEVSDNGVISGSNREIQGFKTNPQGSNTQTQTSANTLPTTASNDYQARSTQQNALEADIYQAATSQEPSKEVNHDGPFQPMIYASKGREFAPKDRVSDGSGESQDAFTGTNQDTSFQPIIHATKGRESGPKDHEFRAKDRESGPKDHESDGFVEEPPRNGRDYAVSQDNYGWTYPSATGAGSTAGGSASYYPSAEYGKPASTGVDSKYYSWAAPSDDKYKRPSYFTYTVNQGEIWFYFPYW